jgi:hypothetical protein
VTVSLTISAKLAAHVQLGSLQVEVAVTYRTGHVKTAILTQLPTKEIWITGIAFAKKTTTMMTHLSITRC